MLIKRASDIDNMKKGMNNKAFTVIELMVVLLMLTLLTGVIYPVMLQGQVTSKRTLCQFNLKNFSMATEIYCSDNSGYLPAPTQEQNSPFWTTNQWRKVIGPYISGDDVFTCPSIIDITSTDEIGSYVYSMSFYHSPEQINTIKDQNQTITPEKNLEVKAQKMDAVAKPDAKVIYGEWNSNHAMIDDENGWWNWSGQRNFVFSDGHTAFLKAADINSANDTLPDANVTIDGIKGSDYN